jgi:hypothetical protein
MPVRLKPAIIVVVAAVAVVCSSVIMHVRTTAAEHRLTASQFAASKLRAAAVRLLHRAAAVKLLLAAADRLLLLAAVARPSTMAVALAAVAWFTAVESSTLAARTAAPR